MSPTRLALVCAALLVSVLTAEQPRDAVTVSGNFEIADPVKNTVTISIFDRLAAESNNKIFTLAKDAKILKDGVPAKLADLKRGRATLQLSPDGATVVSVAVVGRTVTGAFFDAGKRTITLTMETARQGKVNSTLTLAQDVKVTLAGQPAALTDLKDGTKLQLTLAADDDKVIRIQNAGP